MLNEVEYLEEVYIERERGILRIALREEGKLKECFIEEEKEEPSPGEIYKGVVKNIVPAIKCAFIDIGFNKNAFMYLHRRYGNENIKKGDELIVEIMKEPIGEKGPKVTGFISIPGRYAVIVTNNNEINFSKKIGNNENFIEYINENLIKPTDIGIMIRTSALDVDVEDINTEISELYHTYKRIIQEGIYAIKPKLLYDRGGNLGRLGMDVLSSDTNRVVLNTERDCHYIKEYIKNKPDLNLEIELHQDKESVFSYYNIEKEILSLRNSKVVLPSGGNIVIEKTEAMYVIDVNSGKNVKQNSIDKTALETNLEAAEEISNQVMMRNLGGIILIDFIDMDNFNYKKRVLRALKEGFREDKKKTVVYPFTELNLVQIARKRSGKSIYGYIDEDCKICHGKSKRIKLSYINKLIKNEIVRISKGYEIRDIYIEIDEVYKKDILGDVLNFVGEIESLDKKIYVNFMENLEYFKVEPLLFASQVKKFEDLRIYG